jgi:hypothetical protein
MMKIYIPAVITPKTGPQRESIIALILICAAVLVFSAKEKSGFSETAFKTGFFKN